MASVLIFMLLFPVIFTLIFTGTEPGTELGTNYRHGSNKTVVWSTACQKSDLFGTGKAIYIYASRRPGFYRIAKVIPWQKLFPRSNRLVH